MEFLSACYFRAHLYTIVPRHVREDMEWMADVGTNAVVVGILEQDLFAAVENLAIVAAEAERVGLRLYATPSRWGPLVAGCPKVPSIFSASRPEVWSLCKDGSPWLSFGPVASVHHPATYEFFVQGPYFVEAAHRAGKKAFMLIENHAMAPRDIDLMDRRLPEVLALGAEHLCYYYSPRSVSEPDRAMRVLAKHLKAR